MLVPSSDWREIDPYHTQVATFRAIENGYSLVRQTGNGLAMTVDYEGNVLSASDYFTTDPQVMVAYVPMQGVHTIYATIGDLFAWLSVAGMVVLTGVAVASRNGHTVNRGPIKRRSHSEWTPGGHQQENAHDWRRTSLDQQRGRGGLAIANVIRPNAALISARLA